jgi:hypothetical protein
MFVYCTGVLPSGILRSNSSIACDQAQGFSYTFSDVIEFFIDMYPVNLSMLIPTPSRALRQEAEENADTQPRRA